MVDFNMKPSFPIEAVIGASQRKAALEQQAKAQDTDQLVQGLGAIQKVGQSLVDQRLQVARSLALGKQFGIPDDQARLMQPDDILKTAAVNKGGIDMQMLFTLLHPNAAAAQAGTANAANAQGATPASNPSPAPQGNGAMLTGGLGAPQPIPAAPLPGGVDPSTATVPSPVASTPAPVPVPIPAPPSKPMMVNPATAKMAFQMTQANRMEPVMTRSQAEAQGGVKHGTHILPDEKGPKDLMSPEYQGKLEKQYADMRMKALSNRSGGLGLQDSKVNQAFDLRKLVNKYYDPKTGEFNIPPSQHAELALGLARLVSPTGQVGIELMHELRQGTGREALSKALIYAGADPTKVGGPTQSVARMFIDSVDRQGETAEQLRDQYMQYISDNAPTDLDPSRKAKHDQGKLNSFNDFLSKSPDHLPKASEDQGAAWTDDHEKRLQMLLEKQKNGALKS
jgi:hypothetical protein